MKFITYHSEAWKLDKQSPEAVLQTEVNLSAYGLSEPPVVTANLYGNQKTSFSLGLCEATAQGFTVSLTLNKRSEPKEDESVARTLTPELAAELGLSVYWIVIGS